MILVLFFRPAFPETFRPSISPLLCSSNTRNTRRRYLRGSHGLEVGGLALKLLRCGLRGVVCLLYTVRQLGDLGVGRHEPLGRTVQFALQSVHLGTQSVSLRLQLAARLFNE